MNCRNHFCIYWDSYECLLDNIELDESGSCRSCITVDLETELLESARTSLREELENSEEPAEDKFMIQKRRLNDTNAMRALLPLDDQNLILRFETALNEMSIEELEVFLHEEIYDLKTLKKRLHL